MFNVCALGHPTHIPTVIQFRSMFPSISATAGVMRSCSACSIVGIGGYINFVLHIIHCKKSHGARSGNLRDHGNRGTSSRPARPMQRHLVQGHYRSAI
ncbi:hypothetical protein AVEN_85766-1 [Araneus ventricosus]|uniref:Uncharacterized protein n=1 Tax=Araneus ventricosus TaxID=182803 RepID=A0A4Y2SF56_ARAVE|nr:hypothetical protein AVEN_85766-1 [Araneus ventricosus]